jgi:twinfilin-like protein
MILTPDLEETFKKGNQENMVRVIQVKINEDKLEMSFSSPPTSVAEDYNLMKDHVAQNEACYFLFQIEPKRWLLITYVPDGVMVKDKMIYASSKGALKSKLGFSFFEEEIHATSIQELSYDYYANSRKPIDSRSGNEIIRENLLKLEDQERTERTKPSGIGGYHSVGIPLSTDAKTILNNLKSGSLNFVELEIDDSKEHVNGIGKSILITQLNQNIIATEPRFYVYLFQSNRGIQKESLVFIYCCPDKSPPKLRMVYSTAKPQVANQIEQLGLKLSKKRLEIREGSDLTEEFLNSEIFPQKSYSSPSISKVMVNSDGTTKASNLLTVSSPHPICSMLDLNNSKEKRTKKIVIPPKGAW